MFCECYASCNTLAIWRIIENPDMAAADCAGPSKAGKAKIPPERLILYFPKFLHKYSWGWIPKRVLIGDVPESLMPLYVPCRRALDAASKAVHQHYLKVLLSLAAIFLVAWLIKWEPPPGLGMPRQY